MGIQGLPAFIRTRAKECIRDLKLADLHGRRVAIDGNIITQRFHHSTESQHPNRTILGWYRFIRNLKSYAITPIVVFDGSRRVSAKARELERRLNARQLLAGRAESEEARTSRLLALKDITTALQALKQHERASILQETNVLLEKLAASPLAEEDGMISGMNNKTSLATRFAHLTRDMQTTRIADAAVLSKRQITIAKDEAQAFVRSLSPSPTIVPEQSQCAEHEDDADPLAALQTVLDESITVAGEYARRSTPITKETYTNCMDILRALGVPVLLTSNTEPQEAESLCSSLVEASLADLVVTEDTDVLVFDAPMLRRIGPVSREGELIHGREVRKTLGFDTREQWVDFCLLCGCDFIERIKGLGPARAYKLLKEHGTIEDILASGALEKLPRMIKPPSDLTSYFTDIAAARAIFLSPAPVDSIDKEQIALKTEDANINSIMRGFGLDPEASEVLGGFENMYIADAQNHQENDLEHVSDFSDSPGEGFPEFNSYQEFPTVR